MERQSTVGLDFFDSQKFIYSSCNLAWDSVKNNKYEVKGSRDVGWLNKTLSNFDKNKNSLYIITGKKSDLTVIDIDDGEKCKELVDMLNPIETLKVRTRKGFHCYFKYISNIKNMNRSQEMGFDVLTDDKCVYAPPSYYQISESLKFTYDFIDMIEPVQIPDEIENYLRKKHIEKLVKTHIEKSSCEKSSSEKKQIKQK